MTHTEHPAKHPRTRERGREIASDDGRALAGAEEMRPANPSPRTGASATLRAFLRGCGSGAPTHGPRSTTGRAPRLAAALALAAAAILLAAAPAGAEIFHPFLPPPIKGADTPGGSFAGISGLAVDNSAGPNAGDLFVVDDPEKALDRLSPTGAYQCQITGAGYASASASASECDSSSSEAENPAVPGGSLGANNFNIVGVAIDPAGGDVYVAASRIFPESGIVDRFSPAGKYLEQITGLPSVRALAVDPATGDLYIAEGGTDVKRWDPATKTLTVFATESPGGGQLRPTALAVDPSTGDLYVADGTSSTQSLVDKFDPAGSPLAGWAGGARLAGTPAGPFAPGLLYLAVDPSSSDLYVDEEEGEAVDQFDSAAVFRGRTSISSPELPALAVASSGDLFVATRAFSSNLIDRFGPGITIPDTATEAATELTPTTATLNGALSTAGSEPEDALASCRFEYATAAEYSAEGFQGPGAKSAACAEPAAAEVPLDTASHPVKAKVSGLLPGTTYRFRLVAENQNHNPNTFAAVESFATVPPPRIDEAKAIEVGPSSATLTTEIDPRGAATECQIEWGIATEPFGEGGSYEHAQPCEPPGLGNGTADVAASLHLEGLTAGVTYHWRVLATSHCNPAAPAEECPATSPDHTFVYLPPQAALVDQACPNQALRAENFSLSLPECRAYEQVSPTHKNGSLLGVGIFATEPLVSADGSRVFTTAIQCFAAARSCNADGPSIASPFAFTRSAAGWAASALSPPAIPSGSINHGPYSATAGTALFIMATPPQVESHFYARAPDGSFADIGPLTPPSAGPTPFGEVQEVQTTADLSHLVWDFNTGNGGLWPFDQTSGSQTLYEYAGAGNEHPLLVGVGGPDDGPGSTDLISTCSTRLPEAPGALSADGRIVYFVAAQCATGSGANAGVEVPADTLYARVENTEPGAHTVAISQHSPTGCSGVCAVSPAANAFLAGASEEGSKAYFLSTQQLTDAASEDSTKGDSAAGANGPRCFETTGPGGCNLYLYDFKAPAGHNLIDASAGDTSGKGPRVQGVMAVSSDGSRAYFVAKGLLAGPNAEGRSPTAGAENLYLYDAAAGQTRFIATLLPSDDQGFPIHLWTEARTWANLTPDGRFLLFTSAAQLTPDDTSASGARQVFRYDAVSEALTRISIGEQGFNDNGNRSTATPCTTVGARFCAEEAHIAPGNKIATLGPNRPDPTMSDDGSRIFFTSPLALTPGALETVPIGTGINGLTEYAQNVYEWNAGHVYLISDGRDSSFDAGQAPLACNGILSSVCLLGADAKGENVFFSTTDQLTPSDTDTGLDYYDARVDGGFPKAAEPEICLTADACHGKGSEEGLLSSPATPGFNGPEEGPSHPQKAGCRKGSVKRHGRCVSKKHHAKKHRRSKKHSSKRSAHNNRRASR